jgi:16S rRNA G966 N2-methylase RsmD
MLDMEISKIKEKFGDFYIADENTFKMGIDKRIASIISERFINRIVLETCTGAGFTTLSLANYSEHVYTIEIEKTHQEQAIQNITNAKLSEKVTFILGDILNENLLNNLPKINSAFLDPDWADMNINHTYCFKNSNTKPPADILLKTISKITQNIALILPPFIGRSEFSDLLPHELQRIYLDREHVLYCLYFGELAKYVGETELRINA